MFGAVGAVIDAPTRDIKLIEEDGFHLFSAGVQSTDAYSIRLRGCGYQY